MSTDYYLLDELLTDEARAVRDRVRAFVEADLLPVINDYWDRADFPWPLVPKIAELGVVGGTIEGYGCPGLSPLAAGMASLEMSRGDGSIHTFFGVQSGLAMGSINMLGSEEQKQRWVPAMATLDKIGAFALTEPNHGSDSAALGPTRARATVARVRCRAPGGGPCAATATSSSSTGRSAGSATRASPTSSWCGRATS